MNLTNKHREDVIVRAIAATFAKGEAAYAKSRTALGDALYADRYGEHEKTANKLPQGWLDSSTTIAISMPGFKHWSSDKGCQGSLAMSKSRRFPLHGSTNNTVRAGDALHDQATALLAEYEALEAAKAELESKLRGILWACTTLAKLEALWPEGKKFFPAEQPKQTAVVPYDLALSVNKIMGIGPAAKRK